MRGARPDAECPRCHHRQPPAEGALATCLKCGLSYPPKELQQRAKKPTHQPHPSNELAIVQPTSLAIDEAGGELTYRWSDHPNAAPLTIVASSALAILLWTAEVTFNEKLGYSLFLVTLIAFGLFQARRTPKLALDNSQLTTPTGAILLSDIEHIDLEADGIVAKLRFKKTRLVVTARDREILAFVAADLDRRINRE